jgi:hypothetical protein
MATLADLDALAEGERQMLTAEREQIREDLRAGLRPVVCLSGPRERVRLVQVTSLRDLDNGRLPWARLARG